MKKIVRYSLGCVIPVILVCSVITYSVILVLNLADDTDRESNEDDEEYIYNDEFGGIDTDEVNDPYEASVQELMTQEAQMKELDIQIMENREDEMLFQVSIDDFIDSYNGFYWRDKKVRYLLPSLEWRSYVYDTAIHSRHETCCHVFSKDENILPLPTITVYTPSNNDYIQEITVNFDDHSYMDSLYEIYEEICFYTLRVMFPDLADDKIINLYTTLNQLAYDNVTTIKYTSESVPCALYYRDGIGVYPYFALGECVHLCIIPVTEQYLSDMRAKGVAVYEIQ